MLQGLRAAKQSKIPHHAEHPISNRCLPRPHSRKPYPQLSKFHISNVPPLSCRGLHLGRCALGPLLTRDLASSRTGRALSLLGLLLALAGSLLVLGLLDSGLTGGGARFGALAAAFFDHVQRGSDDGALVLDGAAGAFLGDFL